ncbi:hypothetical protein L1077_16580 [Pseudoalteromonas luteoviolacea]|uniref:hypothetical protein n=1 Tax=Pseudoalteromonas luteoviolacea TaxID=43657 RepID=UPI001F20C6B6|nr:hypothetical protein [Pseudoalteromonas luteoviolacea]MCF6441054.1 hypothetical protein [Pseudoalteromonas luteoviolacea]
MINKEIFFKETANQTLNFSPSRIARLTKSELNKALVGFGKTKMRNAIEYVASHPGDITHVVRSQSGCSNISEAFRNANKRLLNVGLMVVCKPQKGKGKTQDVHQWYLIHAPIVQVKVQHASNDPR